MMVRCDCPRNFSENWKQIACSVTAAISLVRERYGREAPARSLGKALWLGCLSATVGLVSISFSVAQDGPFPEVDKLDKELTETWVSQVVPVLEKHCGECHMKGANEAGVNLGDYDSLEKIRSHDSTWEQIRGVIRAEAMPPPESSTMTAEERGVVMGWVERALHEIDCGCVPAPPKVTVRRLNQFEYDNTIRDLFGLELKPSKQIGFVSDDVGNGFDNQGEVLWLPPIAMEKYLQSAALISEKVIATDREVFRKQSFEGETLGYHESMKVPVYIATGKYTASVRTRFGEGQIDNCKAKLFLDDQMVSEWEVLPKDETTKIDFEVTAGEHQLRIEYSEDQNPEVRNVPNRKLIIHSLRLVGPEQGEPAYPREHERVVIAYPDTLDQPEGRPIGFTEATRRVFQAILPRIYRRVVDDEEVHAVMITELHRDCLIFFGRACPTRGC